MEKNKLIFLLFILILLNTAFITDIMIYAQESHPRITISFDDPNTAASPLLLWENLNENILFVLKKNNLQAALFVCGKRINDENRAVLIKRWDTFQSTQLTGI